jgi:hypothetical protein
LSIIFSIDLTNSQLFISPTTGRGTENEKNKDDDDNGDDIDDDEAKEGNIAVTRADSDTANLEFAQLATEKANAEEKRLIVLEERKGKERRYHQQSGKMEPSAWYC